MNYIGQLPEGAKKIPGVRAWATTDGKIYGKETRTFSRDGKVFYFKHYGEYFEYFHAKQSNKDFLLYYQF